MMEIAQVVVFLMGVAAVGFAVYFHFFFSRSKSEISRAMKSLMREQIVSAVGTMLFSISSMVEMIVGTPVEMWNSVPPSIANTIRAVMFGFMLYSTIKLSFVVMRTVQDSEKRND